MAAEAVGLASSLTALVATAYSSCQKVDSIFEGARNAPKHIKALSSDLEDFYLVLGTLQALLDDEDISPGVTRQATSLNLCKVLENCISIFKNISVVASEYQIHHKRSEPRTWQRLKWTFKESEIDGFRRDLMGCKATLNMSISVANFYNTRATVTSTAKMEADLTAHLEELEKLPEILQQMEDIRAAQIPLATPHGAIERASIRVDYTFALRHYMDDAVSMCSEIMTPAAPSLQVSSFEPTDSITTSRFHTAPVSQTFGDEAGQSSRCTQILVRNVGLHRTIILQTKPEYTIETIKILVREKIGMPNAQFDFLYSSRTLGSPGRSLEEYKIPHDATLTCVSFRPERPPGVNPPQALSVFPERLMVLITDVKRFSLSYSQRDHLIDVHPNATVSVLKSQYTDALGGNWTVEDVVLIWKGHNLQNNTMVSAIGIEEDDLVLHALLRYDAVSLHWEKEIARISEVTAYQSMQQAEKQRSMHTIEWVETPKEKGTSNRHAGQLASNSSLDAILAFSRGVSRCPFGDGTIWYVRYA